MANRRLPSTAMYEGYCVSVMRVGCRGGYRAYAVNLETEKVLSTHLHTGNGAKMRALQDIFIQVDIEIRIDAAKALQESR
jgi:hypothetical protein